MKLLPANEKKMYENKMHQRLLTSDLWKHAAVVGMTYARFFEWNTTPLIESAIKMDKTVVLPKCNPLTHTMTFYVIHHISDLEAGYADILEPDPSISASIAKQDIDMLLVPGTVFDQAGYRIGFGGGYYDRFLEDYSGTAVSLAAEFQFIDKVPREAFDYPVQHIITEDRLLMI